MQDWPPAFKATWAWTEQPESVHSYPHVKLSVPGLPVPLSNISALLLSAQWSLGLGSTALPILDVDTPGLEDIGVAANVAFDIFADRNPVKAMSATTAETEIMIWVGRFGSAQPLGYSSGRTCLNLTVGRVELYVAGLPSEPPCNLTMPCSR